MPERIRMSRAKGWRLPEGAIYVGRPTRWGNPYRIGATGLRFVGEVAGDVLDYGGRPCYADCEIHGEGLTAAQAVAMYRDGLEGLTEYLPSHIEILGDRECVDEARALVLTLAGHDLACWCPLDQPCHADVLLEVANRGWPE